MYRFIHLDKGDDIIMNLYLYYAIFSVILIIGVAATLIIGFSRGNREGDQTYFQKTGTKWVRLTVIYVISIAAGLLSLFLYIRNFIDQ